MKKKLEIGNWQLVVKVTAILIALIAIYYLPFTNLSKAQILPEFMITWKANNYAPTDYLGKIIPIKSTAVDVSMELIDKGKLANLSPYEVRWFVDDGLQTAGFGMKNFTFDIASFTGKSAALLRAEVINYRGTNLEKTIAIPIGEPELVIAHPNKNIFKAFPYFFNTSKIGDLSFTWSINNISSSGPSEDPDVLLLDLAKISAGTSLNLNVIAENPKNLIETINKSLDFIVQ